MLSISPKGLSYYHSFISIPNHVRLSLIGAGPGKAGSFIGKEHQAFLTKKYFMKYDIPQFRMGNSIMTLPYTGINTIQSELGYLGTILFFITIFFVIWRLMKINRANFNHKKYFVIGEVDFMAYFCVLFFVAENILADYLQQSLFPLIVWILISFSYFFDSKYYNRKKHRLKMNLT